MNDFSEKYSNLLRCVLPDSTQERRAQLLHHTRVLKALDNFMSSIKTLDEEIMVVNAPIYVLQNAESQDISELSYETQDDGINLTKEPIVMQRSYSRLCAPIFFLPNAKVGENYSAKIDIRFVTDDVNILIEQVLSTNDDFTLQYDPKTRCMSGLPKKAGSFTLGIRWKVEGYASESTNIEFIVNPDPNSLWKNLPVDENDHYFKSNDIHQYFVNGVCNIAAASCRGRSHAHVGSFRDDDFWVSTLDNGWNITIVSDGAGSAKNSRKGSAILVQTIGGFLQSQLSSEAHQNLVEQVNVWDDCAREVLGQCFKQWFRDAAVLAVKTIEDEAINVNQPVKSYSSTLLAAVTLKVDDQLFAATFWVGDGAIVAYSITDNVRVLGQVDSGEFAGQTRFLDNAVVRDVAFYDRIRIGKWPNISHFLLMTDGISDPKFETDAALLETEHWRTLIEEIDPLLTQDEKSAEALLKWMKFPSPGHHDDRTLIVLW